MEKWKYKVWLIIIISAVIICYPFFAIKYFETTTALIITTNYFLLPIILFLSLFGPRFYFRKVKPLDWEVPKNKLKRKARDIISIIMMIICSSGISFGIVFSLIITTNQLFGTSEVVKIKATVEHYDIDIRRRGKIRHYIEFKDPKTQKTIELEVYRGYYVGDTFEKEMKYGAWGILYSTK